jgi:hypothetical protein
MGHEPDRGSCTGNVLSIEKSKNVFVKHCELFGCGAYGLHFKEVDNFSMSDCLIHGCTYGIMDIRESRELKLSNCKFSRNKRFDGIKLYHCRDVSYELCNITENKLESIFNIVSSGLIRMSKGSISQNQAERDCNDPDMVVIEDVSMDNNRFEVTRLRTR